MTTTYRVHGTTDDTDACEICGKVDLRSVVMLAVLEDGTETGELIYVGTTCAARALAQRGTRTTAAKVRGAAGTAERVITQARKFADEFRDISVNDYIAANSVAYLNANRGDITAALAAAKAGHVALMAELAIIDGGTVMGTRFEDSLPTI